MFTKIFVLSIKWLKVLLWWSNVTLLFFLQEKFWSLDETEQHLAPIFMVQIWDNDKFSFDDFLGKILSDIEIQVELNVHFFNSCHVE